MGTAEKHRSSHNSYEHILQGGGRSRHQGTTLGSSGPLSCSCLTLRLTLLIQGDNLCKIINIKASFVEYYREAPPKFNLTL